MKDKDTVNYRQGTSLKLCMFCSMYRIFGRCTLVKGDIGLTTTCDEWSL